MWAYSPKHCQNGNFWYKFAPEGYIPLSGFTKFCVGEGAPGPHPQAKFCRCSFKNVAFSAPKIAKIGNFW